MFRKKNKLLEFWQVVVKFIDNIAEKEEQRCKSFAEELMASQFYFGKRLRVTGHEYRKTDYGAALRWGCSSENRVLSKRWHPSFNVFRNDFHGFRVFAFNFSEFSHLTVIPLYSLPFDFVSFFYAFDFFVLACMSFVLLSFNYLSGYAVAVPHGSTVGVTGADSLVTPPPPRPGRPALTGRSRWPLHRAGCADRLSHVWWLTLPS